MTLSTGTREGATGGDSVSGTSGSTFGGTSGGTAGGTREAIRWWYQ